LARGIERPLDAATAAAEAVAAGNLGAEPSLSGAAGRGRLPAAILAIQHGLTAIVAGGTVDTSSALSSSSGSVIIRNSGTLVHRGGNIGSLTIENGATVRIITPAALTIATLSMLGGGSLDVSESTGAITITDIGEENTYYVNEFGHLFFCKNYPSRDSQLYITN
jgi:hypothetical protein